MGETIQNKMSDLFSIARMIVGMTILGLASISDLRTRTVDNKYWIIMGTAAIIILFAEVLVDLIGGVDINTDRYSSIHLLALVPTVIMFYDVFWDREPLVGDKGVNFTALAAFIIVIVSALVVVNKNGLDIPTIQLLSIPMMIIIGYIFFYTGLIHGGADAKAFMSIAILVPFLPTIGDVIPMIQYPENMVEIMPMMFPFAFLVLMNAAIISVIGFVLFMFMLNMKRKDHLFPALFFGYKMNIIDVPKKFVWLMEVVRDEEIVMYLFGKRKADTKEELVKLKEFGISDVWVTPKLPFIVPMFIGFIFSFIIGNVMTLLFNAIL